MTIGLAAAPAVFPPSGAEVVFVLLGVVALAAAVLVVTTRQIVHAALWLCVGFGALGGCYLVLTAEVVAWVQVLIYVGAITVLLLFGMMLTRAPVGRSADLNSGNRFAALVLGLGLAALLVTVLVPAFGGAWLDLGRTPLGGPVIVGAALFRGWVLPFELLSVLLLAALIGAVVLSRTDIGRTDTARADSGTGRNGSGRVRAGRSEPSGPDGHGSGPGHRSERREG